MSAVQFPSSENIVLKKGAGKYLALVFVLVFLLFQSTSLLHTHSGDLNKHIDCQLCLKIGAGDDLVLSSAKLPEVPGAIDDFPVLEVGAPAIQSLTANSRAPPLALLI